jgi:hypothetical protein
MPNIRRTTDNKIVTKDGLPSCACCGESNCEPDVVEVYAELLLNQFGDDPSVVYITMTGSLNVGGGYFSGDGGTLYWNGEKWRLEYASFGTDEGVFEGCDPQGYYYGETETDTLDATISYTPLP